MNNKVKFIDTKYLKSNTTIEDNVDDDILVPFIYMSQDINIQKALGSNFYNHLKNGVVNNTLSNDEKTLIVDYIQMMVCRWTIYYALPDIWTKITNKSVSTNRSEYGDPVDTQKFIKLENRYRDLAEFYTERLVTFMEQNCDLFDQYKNPGNKENVRRSGRSYFNGLYIPRR